VRRLLLLLLAVSLLSLLPGCGNKQEENYQSAMDAVESHQGAMDAVENYQNAMDALESENYVKAIELLSELGDYQDAQEKLADAQLLYGRSLYKNGDYERAEEVLSPLGDKAKELLGIIHFEQAQAALDNGDYEAAIALFELVEGKNEAQASNMIQSIQNLDRINEIIEEIDKEYCRRDSLFYNTYLGSWGLDFGFDLHYDLPSSTFYFDIYYPKTFSDIASLVGTSLQEQETGESTGMEKTLYQEFADRDVQSVAVTVSYYEYDGTPLTSHSYTPEDYARETAEEQAKWNGNFRIDNGVLTEYTGDDVNLTIPDGVTAIGDKAFEGNTTLESVSFPNSLLEIGYGAFSGCSNLSNVAFPPNLESISGEAFRNCNLKSLHLPKSIQDVGYNSFIENPITSITFENGITMIPPNIGSDISTVSEVLIPEGVQEIGNHAFSGKGLLKLSLPSTLKKVYPVALSNLEDTEITFAGTKAQWEAISGNFAKENVQCSDGLYSSYSFYKPTGQETSISFSELWDLEDVYAYEGEMILITDCIISRAGGYQDFLIRDDRNQEEVQASVTTTESCDALWGTYSTERPPVFHNGDRISFYGRVEYDTRTFWDGERTAYAVTPYFTDATIVEP